MHNAQCASCRGADLEGQSDWSTRGANGLLPAPPQDTSGHAWNLPDATLFRITKYGEAKAAGLKHYGLSKPAYYVLLSDEEIIAVLSWFKPRWPAPLRGKHDQMNAQRLLINRR
jgi:hypothetical protein